MTTTAIRSLRRVQLTDDTTTTDPMLGQIDILKVREEQLFGVSPWWDIHTAMADIDYNYGWNTGGTGVIGTDTAARQLSAIYHEKNEDPLDFGGAINIYQAYYKMAMRGREIDFNKDPTGANTIMNDLLAITGTDHSLTWQFMQQLAERANEAGHWYVMKPKTYKAQAAVLPGQTAPSLDPLAAIIDWLKKNAWKAAPLILLTAGLFGAFVYGTAKMERGGK